MRRSRRVDTLALWLIITLVMVLLVASMAVGARRPLGEREEQTGPSGREAATPGPDRKAGLPSRSPSRHTLAWWQSRNAPGWRAYRAEHHRWKLEQRHRRRLTHALARARTVQAHASTGTDWRSRQIAAAETIARESGGDPWPNCADPFDGSGASWDDTVRCENGGSWLDSPGFYRCGLQFDPMWERRFGALCP